MKDQEFFDPSGPSPRFEQQPKKPPPDGRPVVPELPSPSIAAERPLAVLVAEVTPIILNLIRNLFIKEEHKPTMVRNGTDAVVTKPIRPPACSGRLPPAPPGAELKRSVGRPTMFLAKAPGGQQRFRRVAAICERDFCRGRLCENHPKPFSSIRSLYDVQQDDTVLPTILNGSTLCEGYLHARMAI